MWADETLAWGAAGAVSVVGVLALFLLRSRRDVLAFLIGVTGVLVAAQIAGGPHVFTLVILLWALVGARTSRTGDLRVPLLVVVASGLLSVTALFGDLVNSRALALQLLALAVSGSLLGLRAEPTDVRLVLRGILATISVGSVVAVLQVLHAVPSQLWHPNVSGIGRPLGIWPEPDWLGLFAAIGLVAAWRMQLRPGWKTAALVLNGMAFVLSFARAAWVALAVSVALAGVVRFLSSSKTLGSRGQRRYAAVLLLAVAAVVVAVPELRNDLGRRLGSLMSPSAQDVSASARIQQVNGLLELSRSAAPFGHGLSASGRVGVSGRLIIGAESVNNVASNWLLGLWVDGALLAAPLIALLVYVAVRQASTASGQALVVVLVNSLWSNAVFMPITWMCLGLAINGLGSRGSALGRSMDHGRELSGPSRAASSESVVRDP